MVGFHPFALCLLTFDCLFPQTPQEADRLQREIAATDGAIDKLVYELYGLTEEEVRIVEGGARLRNETRVLRNRVAGVGLSI